MPKADINKKVFRIPGYILITGRILQFISKELAAHFAMKLFRSPFRFERPSREESRYRRFHKSFLQIPDMGKKIRIYSGNEGKKRKKVLLVHGWAGRGTQMYALADNLEQAGYTVYSFDAPAHGDSGGKTTAMPEFINCILEINENYGPFDYAIGHSLGGMSLLAALNRGLRLQRLVVIAGGNSIYKITHRFIRRLGLREETADVLYRLMSRKLRTDPVTLSADTNAAGIRIPVLVIHDRDDNDVPVSCAEEVFRALPDGSLHLTQGLGHRRILSDPDVIDTVLRFINT